MKNIPKKQHNQKKFAHAKKTLQKQNDLQKNIALPKNNFEQFYAHMLIVVAFLVVKIFGFLVITRDHGSFGGCH